MKYFLLLIFTVSVLAGCGTTQNAVKETAAEQQIQEVEKTEEKPAVKVIQYKHPVVLKETRKYHTGDIDIYKVFEYEKGTDILLSCITYDSADEIIDYIKAEISENTEKQTYYSSNGEIEKIKLIKKDSLGNITEVTMNDAKGNQITRSEYVFTGSLKDKWSIFDSNNALLAYNTYTYDKNGNNTEIKSFSPAGKLEEYFINDFDLEGNIISSKHFDSSDKAVDSTKYVYEKGMIKEESFYKGEKVLQRKKSFSYNDDNSVQTCNVSITGGQTVEIVEKEFFFLDKEKTIIQ